MATPARAWTAEEDAYLREHYATQTRREIAAALGRTAPSLRKRCSVLGLNTKKTASGTPREWAQVRAWYQGHEHSESLDLGTLSRLIGKSVITIQKWAKQMGLTRMGRPHSAAVRAQQSERIKAWLASHDHPRGAQGITHSEETRQRIGERARAAWADPASKLNSQEHRERLSENAIKHVVPRLQKGESMYSRAAHGKRADLDGRYFRSRWEANYARYLRLLQSQGNITAWDYECQTFWFEGIKRGTRSYTPDFKVTLPDGRHEWHEVKGWMDPKSKTRLERMRRYYPAERVVLIEAAWFREARRTGLPALLPGWEVG